MAHFAELDENNVVLRVIVVNNKRVMDENGNEVESIGVEFCKNLLGGNWKQTSYNGNFRKNYAGAGYTYREDIDAFVAPQPYPSWTLNLETAKWEPPVPMPSGIFSIWDEDTQKWVEFKIEGEISS